jgi:hypothetical protein
MRQIAGKLPMPPAWRAGWPLPRAGDRENREFPVHKKAKLGQGLAPG